MVLAQGIVRPDLAEQTSGPDTSNEDARLASEPVLYVCMTCGISFVVLWYARKVIVFAYGYGRGMRFYLIGAYDGRHLREIARKQTSQRRRRLFNLINILIPVSWLACALVGILGFIVIPGVRTMIERIAR